MANLNIGASLGTVTTLAGLPVDKGTIYATLSAASNLSLASAMYQGQKVVVVINPTAKITLPMPTTTGWYTTFGDTLSLITGVKCILTITCIGANTYLIDCETTLGNSINGYEFVDLGLPSGLLWATCNIGASQPQEYGKYFQWGATTGYYSGSTAATNSYWKTCPFNNGQTTNQNSYFLTVSGSVCPNGTLALQYDAAYTNMGSAWRMPTINNINELITNTTSAWTVMNGVSGVTLTSKTNSKTLFLPASGSYYSGTTGSIGTEGYIWSSTLYERISGSLADLTRSHHMWFRKTSIFAKFNDVNSTGTRYYAKPIRGVIG